MDKFEMTGRLDDLEQAIINRVRAFDALGPNGEHTGNREFMKVYENARDYATVLRLQILDKFPD